MAIYMKYGSPDIKGDVQPDNYKDFIALNSFQWGCGRGIDNTNSSDADRENTIPSVSEIVVTKDNDGASTNLMRAALGVGDVSKGKDVEVHFVRTGTSGPEDYLAMTLHKCLISGWSCSAGGGEDSRPVETVTLNFCQVEYKNTPAGADMSDTGADTARYDMTTHSGG
jgi:type VI secretion system secreted protein Hcp